MSPCGPTACLAFTTQVQGQDIAMRASLGQGDDAVSLEYDAGQLQAAPGASASRVRWGSSGRTPALLPELTAPAERVLSATPQVVPAAGLRSQRFAIWNAALDETLQVDFSAPAFSALEWGRGIRGMTSFWSTLTTVRRGR